MKELKIEQLGGLCPVQAEGTVNCVPFYFRARYGYWSMGIGKDPVGAGFKDNDAWYYAEDWPHGEYQAGYMSKEDAVECIHKAAKLYLENKEVSVER